MSRARLAGNAVVYPGDYLWLIFSQVAAGAAMVKLAIFCDGTWNGLRMPELTNVARLARSVKQQSDPQDGKPAVPQIVFYDEGVGVTTGVSRTNDRLESILGGAFGAGLDRKIEEAYRFIVLNYQPLDDEIYIFGFSRGAYTARSLCGLIRKCGILRRECLDRIPEAIRLYRDRTLHPSGPECQEFRRRYGYPDEATGSEDFNPAKSKQENKRDLIGIKYLGLWDTVGSMGVPDRFFWLSGLNRKYRFHDTNASSLIESLRHAIAADEDRRVFGATPFANIRQLNIDAATKALADGGPVVPVEGSPVAAEDRRPYQQKWFPGDHGSVGGGNPQLGLSSAALLWVADGAMKAGLALHDHPVTDRGKDLGVARNAALATADWRVGKTAGSSKPAWACDFLGLIGGYRARAFTITDQEIHDSARERWKALPDYGPKVFEPHAYRLVTPLHRKVELFIGPPFRLLLLLAMALATVVVVWLATLLAIDLLSLIPWPVTQDAAIGLQAVLDSVGRWLQHVFAASKP